MAEEYLRAGEVFTPGSPEDVQQLMGLLNEFISAKIQAIDLYNNGQATTSNSTGGTKSACHSDGVNDGDDTGKLPDV